jgi:hypothetical protein
VSTPRREGVDELDEVVAIDDGRISSLKVRVLMMW